METLHTLLFVLQVLVAVALIVFILIQHGRGADAGAAFGSGSSSTVFGSQGATGFLSKVTTILAIIFLGNSLLLAYLATQSIRQKPASLLDNSAVVIEQEAAETKQDIPAIETEQQDMPAISGTEMETEQEDMPAIQVEQDIPLIIEQQSDMQDSDLPELPTK